MKVKNITIIAGSVFAVLLIVVYLITINTPRYTLYRMKEALNNNNVENAMQYIDIDRMVRDAVNAELEHETDDVTTALTSMMIAPMQEAAKQSLQSMLTENNVFQKSSIWSWNIEQDGSTATVNNSEIKFTMQKADGKWRIIKIE